MSSGASVRDSGASAGSSATQGAHQVAQKFITMPWPENSARVWRAVGRDKPDAGGAPADPPSPAPSPAASASSARGLRRSARR